MNLFSSDKENSKTYEIGTEFFNDSPWGCYLEGYREAFELISKQILDKIKSSQFFNRNIFLPIFYLFRHFLELIFKEICMNCDKQLGEVNKYNNHDLKRLFENFKAKAQKVYEEPYKSNQHNDSPFNDFELSQIEHVVNQFHTFDKGSYTFRYPSDLKGHPVWPSSEKVDFLDFYRRMKDIESILIRISYDTMN